jgi:predicted DNA-binding antitoxin AbrB/MazE fold protein
MWLWQLSALGDRFQDLVARAREARITGVIVKAHDGFVGGKWFDQLRAVISAFEGTDVKVAAWGYVYGRDPAGEAARAVEALRAGASFYVVDAESEFERKGMDEVAAQFFFRLLQEIPDAVLGFTSFAVTNLHPAFPWTTFANHCQFAMPQVYWKEIGWTVGVAWSKAWASYVGLGRPIVPVLQAYGGVSPHDMLAAAELAKRYGCTGVSWWSWQHAGRDQLEAIKEAGRLFGVGKDYAGRWSEKAIERAKELGIMSDYEDGTFRPTQPLTREEAAAVVVKMWDAIAKQTAANLREMARRIDDLAGRLAAGGYGEGEG